MSTTKVSALSAKTNTSGSEELLVNDNGTSKKVTITNVLPDDSVLEKHLNLISTSSVPSLEAKGTSGSTSGYIKLNCSENSHGIKLLGPPHSATADYTLTFPNDDGSNGQKLTTNGSGVLTWTADANTVYTHPNHSGDVTSSADGAQTIAADAVTYAKMQNVSADERILGRVSGANGVIEELTKAQMLTMLNVEDGATADQTATQIKTALENGIDSVHYVDASIDLAHMSSESVDEDNLHISNSPTNGYVLTAQSGNTGGMTWAEIESGNVTTNGLYEMANTIASNYTIGNNNNAMSAGPITINSNISVTVPSGSTWVIA